MLRLEKKGIRLFVGSQGGTVRGETEFSRERENLTGDRCFTAAYRYAGAKVYTQPTNLNVLLDSGAFSHRLDCRLTLEEALLNQLNWEKKFALRQGFQSWQAYALASYDLLIDEVWVNGTKIKQRWSIDEAEEAVKTTVKAAKYLVFQQKYLGDRFLVLGAQGVNAEQYYRCVSKILELGTTSRCWIGLGGWCILGIPQFRYWLPEFHLTISRCIPLIKSAGISHIHLYGVLWEPAVAPFAYLCHQHGLSCSSDSKQPVTACRSNNDTANKRAGARCLYWRDNVSWWQEKMNKIYKSRFYREPVIYQQLSLF